MEADAVNMDFADQSLLSDLYKGCWVPLPYIYNALKTLRWDDVHKPIWRDDKVKNIHYILAPKPWDEMDAEGKNISKDPTHQWWVDANNERLVLEREKGIKGDGF
jgi:lipopolysaccharide biosynthesis glycosyltransferase